MHAVATVAKYIKYSRKLFNIYKYEAKFLKNRVIFSKNVNLL